MNRDLSKRIVEQETIIMQQQDKIDQLIQQNSHYEQQILQYLKQQNNHNKKLKAQQQKIQELDTSYNSFRRSMFQIQKEEGALQLQNQQQQIHIDQKQGDIYELIEEKSILIKRNLQMKQEIETLEKKCQQLQAYNTDHDLALQGATRQLKKVGSKQYANLNESIDIGFVKQQLAMVGRKGGMGLLEDVVRYIMNSVEVVITDYDRIVCIN